jgi:hypothetical protein
MFLIQFSEKSLKWASGEKSSIVLSPQLKKRRRRIKKGGSIEVMWLKGRIILVINSCRGSRAKKKMNGDEGKNVGLPLTFVGHCLIFSR